MVMLEQYQIKTYPINNTTITFEGNKTSENYWYALKQIISFECLHS